MRWPPPLPRSCVAAELRHRPRQPVTMQALAMSINKHGEPQLSSSPQLPMADWEQPVTMSLNHFPPQPQQKPPPQQKPQQKPLSSSEEPPIPMNCNSMSRARTIKIIIRWMMRAAIP